MRPYAASQTLSLSGSARLSRIPRKPRRQCRPTSVACILPPSEELVAQGGFVPSLSSHAPAKTLFIFGLGFVATRLIELVVAQPDSLWQLYGTCQGESGFQQWTRQGQVQPFVFNQQQALSLAGEQALQNSSFVLDTIPPPQESSTQSLSIPDLCTRSKHIWCGHLSSTSVYGDHKGAWVNESSELKATSARAKSRIRAEQAWLQILSSEHHVPAHVFRLGGIYGPGRSALDAVAQEQASDSQQRRASALYTARIHVDDVCHALLASMRRPNPGAIYNVVDDDPASRGCAMQYARQLLGQQPASSKHADAREARRGTSTESKRVSNARMTAELGIQLRYPSYREGLSAIHRGCI